MNLSNSIPTLKDTLLILLLASITSLSLVVLVCRNYFDRFYNFENEKTKCKVCNSDKLEFVSEERVGAQVNPFRYAILSVQ